MENKYVFKYMKEYGWDKVREVCTSHWVIAMGIGSLSKNTRRKMLYAELRMQLFQIGFKTNVVKRIDSSIDLIKNDWMENIHMRNVIIVEYIHEFKVFNFIKSNNPILCLSVYRIRVKS